MSGDYSRHRFSPFDDYSSVLMQQGRVQLDADWNELSAIVDRRFRAGTLDILGRAVVPSETKNAFLITMAGGKPVIGPGRIYVDGILAENHGVQPAAYDPVLAEPGAGSALPFEKQPWFGSFDAIPVVPAGGPHLVYLDVWEREVTHLEDPSLIENAVGVDTTTRMQTVWQVRVLPNIGSSVTCDSKDTDIPGFTALVTPSAGQLTTTAVTAPADDDPCLLPPGAGYRGLENRLYRIQIHDGGTIANATFKWARDNASIASTVTAMPKANQAVVWSVGKDSTLRFNPGDWVELTDDVRELSGQPGIMARIDKVDDPTRLITFTANLPANAFPTNAGGETNPALHTRMVRWDQNGQVRDVDDVLLADLTDNASGGVIPVPTNGAAIVLEDGVQIDFSVAIAGGLFRSGDYWTVAARTADASVEKLVKAPPRGIHHHYCRLAIITLPNTVVDCRTIWPPEFGGDCDCTVCISVDDGPGAIQQAIENFSQTGATICLGPGAFNLGKSPLVISRARGLHIRGHPWTTQLVYFGQGSLLTIDNVEGVRIEDLNLQWSGGNDLSGSAINVRNCIGLTIQRCFFEQAEKRLSQRVPAVGLSDHIASFTFRENWVIADIGIANLSPIAGEERPEAADGPWSPGARLLTSNLRVEQNVLDCLQRAISFETAAFHQGHTVFASNHLLRGQEGVLVARGSTIENQAEVVIDENLVEANGPGIVLGTGRTLLTRNRLVSNGESAGHGIEFSGDDGKDFAEARILANHVSGFNGAGVAILGPIAFAMIKQNAIERTGSGVLMADEASAEVLHIENNRFAELAWRLDAEKMEPSAVRVVHTAKLTISTNTIDGMTADSSPHGMHIIGPTIAGNVTGNQISGVQRPASDERPMHGIAFFGPFGDLQISGNHVDWDVEEGDHMERWALVVAGIRTDGNEPTDVDGIWFIPVRNDILSFHGSLIRRSPGRGGHLTVLGNHFKSDGLGRTVNIRNRGACLFVENHCALARIPEVTGVEIVSLSVNASSNYLYGRMEMDLRASNSSVVLGNITGDIVLNGSPLPQPWLGLNGVNVTL